MGSTPRTNPIPVTEGRLSLRMTLGYAICQICSLFPGSYSAACSSIAGPSKLAGFACILVACYLLDRKRKARVLPYVPSIAVILGTAGIVLTGVASPDPHLAGLLYGTFGSAIYLGASMATIQWLEYCGTLSSKRIIAVLAGGSLVSAVFSLIIERTGVPGFAHGLMCLGFGIVALVLFRSCKTNQPLERILGQCARSLPAKASRDDYTRVFLWTLVLIVTYAIFVTEMKDATPGFSAYTVGKLVVSAAILVCYRVLSDTFDMRLMLSVMLPIVVASLASVGYTHAMTPLPALIFTMGETAAHVLVYAMILGRAFQYRTSSVFMCATTMFLDWLAHYAYGAAREPIVAAIGVDALLFVALIVDSVVIARLVMYELERQSTIDDLPGVRVEVPKSVSALADLKGLTAREKTVFIHMAAGQTNAQISDALFISQGAVRSHASRIYEKLGVATRRELDILVESLE